MRLESFIGKKIRLRAIEPEDVMMLYNWENDPSLSISNDLEAPISKHKIAHFIRQQQGAISPQEKGYLHLIIETKPTEMNPIAAVGSISLYNLNNYHRRTAVGMLISPLFHGRGYGKEALQLMLQYIFNDLGLHQVYAEILDDNTEALALYHKEGFLDTVVLRQWFRIEKKYVDMHILQLTAEEYEQRKKIAMASNDKSL